MDRVHCLGFQLSAVPFCRDRCGMSHSENVQVAARFGIFMLTAGAIGLITGTTLGRSGVIRLEEKPREFYTTCICHLIVGAFCFGGQFFVEA